MLLAFLVEAQSVVEQFGHAFVHDSVVNVAAVSTSIEDAHIGKTTKLVGNRRWFHADGIGEVAHAGIVHAAEGVKNPKSGCAGQHLKYSLQACSISLRE